MTALLVGVFAFFGAHTAGVAGTAYLYLHDSKKFPSQNSNASGRRVVHAVRAVRAVSAFLVVTSFLLVITGMPLKFYYTDWAKLLFGIIGRRAPAHCIVSALITFLYFGLHLVALAIKVWNGRAAVRDPASGQFRFKRFWDVLFGPDSMVPNLQDWRDFIAHNRWFLAGTEAAIRSLDLLGTVRLLCRVLGVAIIGLSGLIMWYPQVFSRFMPGWIINIALIVHSDEALLAAGFIFTIHFFNTHFRLEKFPMDTVIFSGRISRTELLHERKRWYDRLVAEGRLEEHRVKDEWERWKTIARSFGYLFFGVGVILLMLIAYAMISRLTH